MNATLTQRLENLSPAKRVLLEMKLKGKTENFSENPFSIYPRKESGAVPLSFNQESLFFLEQLNPDTSIYNLYEAVRFKGVLNFQALQNALDAIIARHESLRTTFQEIDGQSHQIINAPESVSIQTIDLSAVSIEESERQALEILNGEAARPMNLQRSPLLEIMLVKLAAREHIFLVKMHHIVSDGWSLGVFWKEFAHFYQSFSADGNPSLPKLPVQFADYAIWSRRQLEKDLNRQTRYWKNQLRNAPVLLEMPTDRPRPAIQSYRGGQEIVIFPAELRNELKNLSRRENATLFMTLLAAFNALLARYTGQEDLVVGSPISGRSRTETENLIGFFVNTLALRADLSGDPTFRQLLGQIKDTTLEAFSHQDLPFEKVVAAVRPERSLSYNPIFQVAFALQPKSESSRLNIPGLEISTVKLGSVTAKFDLFLSATETADGELSVTAEYNTDLFDAATIRRLIGHYRNLLEGLTENPNARVSELSLLSETERRQILFDWNETATEYPKDKTVQELFEAQAARNPEKIAVVSKGINYTYEQINRRSNQIAHQLRRLGIAPNMPVGIFMERSELMTCGILGILKSGGAYLPLDASYPQARLEFMLENADVKVILTTRERFAQLPETDATVICLDAAWKPSAADGKTENPANLNQPEDAAYIIYTSGSTG
ncbi:MAG: non-ribosomal peptide synthetase, partial [Pyrinomonadaceae bacterium]